MLRPFAMVAPKDPEANSGLSVAARFTKEEAELLSVALSRASMGSRDTAAALDAMKGTNLGDVVAKRLPTAVLEHLAEADAFAKLHAKVLLLLAEGRTA